MHFVAKLVKSFGGLCNAAESLDDFLDECRAILKTGAAPLVITHNFARNSPIPLIFSYSYSARRAVLVLVLD
jgi:hypothetical protein